jgi:hypothetical protein
MPAFRTALVLVCPGLIGKHDAADDLVALSHGISEAHDKYSDTRPTSTVTSEDGTAIAHTRTGDGSAIIVVDGAFSHRAIDPTSLLSTPAR